MKNNFLLFILCWVGSPLLSFGQTSFGVQSGLHLSSATVDGSVPFLADKQGNFFLGVVARHPINQRWAIGSNLQYTRRGFFFPTIPTVGNLRDGRQLHYIDFSANTDYNVLKNTSLEWGAYVGYRISEYAQGEEAQAWEKAAFPLSYTWDVGLQVGIRAFFQRWSAFIRYSHGVKLMGQLQLTDEDGMPIGTIKLFNKGLQIGAGYRIFNW